MLLCQYSIQYPGCHCSSEALLALNGESSLSNCPVLHDQIASMQTKTSLFGCPCHSHALLKPCELQILFFAVGLLDLGLLFLVNSTNQLHWLILQSAFAFGIQISHAFCTTVINAHTMFTFTYSSCDSLDKMEGIPVTDSERHCTLSRSLFHCGFDSVLHCIVNIELFVFVRLTDFYRVLFDHLLWIIKSKFYTQNKCLNLKG